MAESIELDRLDASNGCILKQVCESQLRLGHPELQALDIIEAPSLTRLEVTDQHPDELLHLRVDEAPQLRSVELPHDSCGVVLHLASSQSVGGLRIHGPTTELDVSSPDGSFALKAPHSGNWPVVVFLAEKEIENLDASQALFGESLMVVTDAAETKTLRLRGARDWVLLACGARSIEHASGGRLEVHKAPVLEELSCASSAARVDLAGTPELIRINGAGESVRLRDEKRELRTLALNGAWVEVTLRCPVLETLEAPDIRHLRLLNCFRLRNVNIGDQLRAECHGSVPSALIDSARFLMDESTVREHLGLVRDGDVGQLADVCVALGRPTRRVDALNGLRFLEGLCELGQDPELIWDTRMRLSASHINPRRKKAEPSAQVMESACGQWFWRFPEGLELEGWQADLTIRSWCQQSVEQARRYRRTLIRNADAPQMICALVQAAAQDEKAGPVQQVTGEALRTASRKSLPRNELAKSERHQDLLLDQLCLPRSLMQVSENVREGMLDYLIAHAKDEILVQQLPQLLPRWPHLIRPRLMKLANPTGSWLESRRRRNRLLELLDETDWQARYMQLALMPVESTYEEECP